MDNSQKLLIGTGVVVGGLVIRKMLTTSSLQKNLTVEASGTIKSGKIIPPSLTFSVVPKLKNETSGTLKVKHPTVKLFLTQPDLDTNNPLTSSDPKDKDYQIPKFGTVSLDPVDITISGLDLILKLLSIIKSKGGLKLLVKQSTYVSLGFAKNLLPVESVKEITFKQ